MDISSYESLNDSTDNYNRYAWSLLRDPVFSKRLTDVVQSADPDQ